MRPAWSRCDSCGGPSSSKDHADLGFAEIDVSEQGSEIRISLVCLVDLSIAVSGSQGTPAQVVGCELVAARGITIRAPPPRGAGNPRLHVLFTTRGRGRLETSGERSLCSREMSAVSRQNSEIRPRPSNTQ